MLAGGKLCSRHARATITSSACYPLIGSNVNLGETFELIEGHMLAISTLAPGRNTVWGEIMLTYRETSMVRFILQQAGGTYGIAAL